jgi:hypothetical protein
VTWELPNILRVSLFLPGDDQTTAYESICQITMLFINLHGWPCKFNSAQRQFLKLTASAQSHIRLPIREDITPMHGLACACNSYLKYSSIELRSMFPEF